MRRTAFLFAVALCAGACATTTPATDPPPGLVAGTLTYRARIALPPDAVAYVRLQDDAGGVLARQTVRADGRQVPLPFELRADPARIVAGARYTVHAEIRNAGGRRLFETSPAMPVLGGPGWTGGPVEILLVAAAPPDEVPTGVRYRLIGFVQGGRGVALPAAEALTLTFGADASYSGQAGCNSFGGSYGSGTGVATLGEARSTMMACPEPSAAAAYLGALGGARVEAVRGATLTLVSPAGDRLTFERE